MIRLKIDQIFAKIMFFMIIFRFVLSFNAEGGALIGYPRSRRAIRHEYGLVRSYHFCSCNGSYRRRRPAGSGLFNWFSCLGLRRVNVRSAAVRGLLVSSAFLAAGFVRSSYSVRALCWVGISKAKACSASLVYPRGVEGATGSNQV